MAPNAMFPYLCVYVIVTNILNFFMSSKSISTDHIIFMLYYVLVEIHTCTYIFCSHIGFYEINFNMVIRFKIYLKNTKEILLVQTLLVASSSGLHH